MKVVILGAGAGMALPTIKFLAKYAKLSKLVLADLNIDAVNQVAKDLNSDKVETTSVDISDIDALKKLVEGSDLVMNFVGPYYKFGTKTLETIIDAKVNYVDICDEGDVTEEALKLDEKAKENGVTALIGLGMSPGMTNVLAKFGSDALDETDEIHTHWVLDEKDLGAGAVTLHLFHSINGEKPTFADGEVKYIKGFQEEDHLTADFGENIGKVNVFHLGHPEPISIPKNIPGVKKVANRGGFTPEMLSLFFRIMGEYGFVKEEPIEVRGIEVQAPEFALTVLNNYLEEKYSEANEEPVFSIQVIVTGKKDGKDVKYTFTKIGQDDMAILTSLPAAAGAVQILEGKMNQPGVNAPECLNAKEFIEYLTEIDYINEKSNYRVERQIGDEVVTGTILDKDKFPELYGK